RRDAVVANTKRRPIRTDGRHLSHTSCITTQLEAGLSKLRHCRKVDARIDHIGRVDLEGDILVEVVLIASREVRCSLATLCIATGRLDRSLQRWRRVQAGVSWLLV